MDTPILLAAIIGSGALLSTFILYVFKRMDGRMDKIEPRLGTMDQKFETKLEAMGQKFETKLEAMDQKFESKLEAMDKQFETKFEAMDQTFETKFEAVNKKLDTMNDRISALSERTARVEGELSAINTHLVRSINIKSPI